jgi:hypothetical protein
MCFLLRTLVLQDLERRLMTQADDMTPHRADKLAAAGEFAAAQRVARRLPTTTRRLLR